MICIVTPFATEAMPTTSQYNLGRFVEGFQVQNWRASKFVLTIPKNHYKNIMIFVEALGGCFHVQFGKLHTNIITFKFQGSTNETELPCNFRSTTLFNWYACTTWYTRGQTAMLIWNTDWIPA